MNNSTTAFTWSSSSRTDVGMVRQINEDACLERPDIGLWVVADGMGGHASGDVASTMIVDSLSEITPPDTLGAFVDEVETRLLNVNTRLREIAAKQETQTIGSTVAALIARGRHGVCMWAGDSRVYRVRDSGLEHMSQDHALVEELVEKGVLTREQAVGHPQTNLVTRAVGAADVLHVDVEIVEFRRGDVFVLCSDGLDKELKEDEIAEVVRRENDKALSEVLVDLALSRGSRDNVTVVTVEIGGQGVTAEQRSDAGDTNLGAEETLPDNDTTRPSSRTTPRIPR